MCLLGGMEKERAPRNRTLTVTREEADALRERLVLPSQLRGGALPIDRTLCGDLLEVLPLLPDAFADLVIIDPPYNLTKRFGQTQFKAMHDDDYEAYVRSWLHAVCNKLKPTGSLYLCGDWKNTAILQRALQDELTILNRITWQREKGRGALHNWKNGMEDIWFAVKNPRAYCFNAERVKMRRRVLAPYRQGGKPKDWCETDAGNYRMTYPSNFWDDISVPFWSMPENTDHPTQKPEKLYAKLLLASSNEGDVVFDPFLGSGTASVVAKKLRRHYVGVEIDETYCLWAEKRLQNASYDNRIQGYASGVFYERNSEETLSAAMRSSERKPRPVAPVLFP